MNDLRWIENSFYITYIIGAILSIFISFESISLLNIAKESKDMVAQFKPFNKLYSRYNSIFSPFWLAFVSIAMAVLVNVLLKGSYQISFWFYILIQVFLSGQFFSLREKLLPVIKAKQIFYDEGTLAGLENLQKPLNYIAHSKNIVQNYDYSIKALIDSLIKYNLLPLLVLYFGNWPYCFLYLIFVIQFEYFQMQNFIFDLVYLIPYNLWITILRLLLHFYKEEKEIKKEFQEKYLNYKQIFKKHGKKLDEKNYAEPLKEEVEDKVIDETNDLNAANQNSDQGDLIDLDFLSILQVLYLTSLNLLLIIFLILFYLKTIF